MDKRAVIFALAGLLALSVLIFIISTYFTSAQDWREYLTLEYNTDHCFETCEAIFTVHNPVLTDISLGNNDVRIWHEVAKGPGLTGNIEVYREETVSYQEEIPDYGTCSYTDGNGTLFEYQCQTGSHKESRTKKEFLPFDFAGKALSKGEIWRIKIVGHKKPPLGENNVEWLINFKGMEPPWAWWLSANYSHYRNNSVNSTITSNIKRIPIPINGSEGFGDSVNKESIWCLLDDLPASAVNGTIIFYYNNATDYRCVNASDKTEFAIETEFGNGTVWTVGKAKSLWQSANYVCVLHANASNYSDSAGICTPKRGFYTTNYNRSGIFGPGYDFNNTKMTINVTVPSGTFNNDWSVEMWVYPMDFSTTGTIFHSYRHWTDGAPGLLTISINTSGGMFGSADISGPTGVQWDTNTSMALNTWHYIVISRDGGDQREYLDGKLVGTYSSLINYDATVFRIGSPTANNNGYALNNSIIDEVRISNSSYTDDDVRARYDVMSLSKLGAEKSQSPEIRNVTITPNPAYTNSILNCSGTYIGTGNGKVDITWYNNSAFYGINSKLDISNGSMVSSLPEAIQNMQDGFDTDVFGSYHPLAITTNGSDFWIADANDNFIYHVNRTGGNMSDGFSAVSEGIATNGSDFWINNGSDIKHVNRVGNDLGDGFKLGFINSLGITTNGTDLWIIDSDNKIVHHKKPDGMGGATNYSDSFSTLGFGSDLPYDLTIRGSDLWIYDLKTSGGDGFIYHVRPDGVGGVINYSDGISVSSMNQPRAITSWPVSYDTTNLGSITDFWITDTNSYLVAHKKRVVADVAKGETWNCTMQASNSAGTGNPNSTTRTISNTPPLIGAVGISNFNNCTAIGYDADLDSLTLNFTWYNGSAYYSSATRATSNGTTASYSLPSGTQKGGETWNCSVFVNDGTNNSALNSNSVTVGYNITFDVRSSEDNSSLNNFNIYCNNSWSATGANSTYSKLFAPGSYECVFENLPFFNKTISFLADSDKTVEVVMSRSGYLSLEEHDMLTAIYNCLINGECIQLLRAINQTTTQIWQQITLTNRNVVTQEQFISNTLSSSSNISISYTVQIPFKQGYANGELLPLRMYFWFTDINRTTCYNQDKQTGSQNRAENLYCFPLVAETLGPNNGSVTFIVDLRPNLTSGNYNVTRAIEIDPILGGEQTWTNYGQEDIGQVRVEESSGEPDINLIKTGETKPAIISPISKITGAAIQGIKSFLSGKEILVLTGMLTFVISLAIICLTLYKIKKLNRS